jgi:flavin-dependent dehydrogenase
LSRRAASPRDADKRIDALVCGGGPAGTTLAAALAAGGHSVVVLERSRYEGPRVGEHLPPNAQPVLEQLGVWKRFRAGPHLPSLGVSAAWGGEAFREQDYLFSPYGQGWNLDRGAFDAMLAHAASAAGAEVLTATHLASIDRREGIWHARLAGGARDGHALTARFAVDATGRAAALARRLGSRRRAHDNLVGLCAWLPRGAHEREDRRLVVEAAEIGWWYTTPLPGERRVAVLLTDRDLVAAGAVGARALWANELARTRTIRMLVATSGTPASFLLRAANTYTLERVAGEDWLAVGDAASALDPLSSMGILKALRNSATAAGALTRSLAGEDDALAVYAQQVEGEFTRYLRDRHQVYARERRWSDAPFWRRRADDPRAVELAATAPS